MLQELINKFIKKYLCCHEWEVLHTCSVYESDNDKRPSRYTVTYVCKNCGEIKQIIYK